MPLVHERGIRVTVWIPESDTALLSAIEADTSKQEPRQGAPSGFVTVKKSRSRVLYEAARRGFGLTDK